MARPKIETYFKVRSYRNRSGSASWRVTGTKPSGERIRQNYQEKGEAVRAAADLELEAAGMREARQAQRTILTPEQLSDAEAAVQAAGGRSLSHLINHYFSLEARCLTKGATFDQAVGFFEDHFRAEILSVSILNAREEFLNSRIGVRRATSRNYESSLKLLLSPNPNKALHEFTVHDLENSLRPYRKANSRRTHARIFSIFFNWAVRHHYCLSNPCERLDRSKREGSKISILSLMEIRRLLAAAVSYRNGVCAAAVAISLFGGLRPSELFELSEDDVSHERIRVTGGKMRRTLKRTVPVPPVLVAWLSSFPFKGLPRGWDYKLKVLKKATNAATWTQDVLRHTSISFQAERDQNEGLTAFNCGTSKEMMDRHYRNSIEDPNEVAEFWKLAPASLNGGAKCSRLPQVSQVRWPSKQTLSIAVAQRPLVQVAKEIGVSDVALRKHCLKLGLTLPKKGRKNRELPAVI